MIVIVHRFELPVVSKNCTALSLTNIFQVKTQALQGTLIDDGLLECPKNLNRTPGDSTCTKYYSCLDINGTFNIKTFTCPNGQYFSTEAQGCQSEIPFDCSLATNNNGIFFVNGTVSLDALKDFLNSIFGNSSNEITTDVLCK